MINSLKSTKACNQDRTIIKNNGLSKLFYDFNSYNYKVDNDKSSPS